LVCLLWLASLAYARQQQAEDQEAIAQRAVEAERRGDFATAVSAFKQLIASRADNPELRSNLGIAYFQLHDYEQAMRQFHLVLSKNAGSVPANLFSGLCLLKLQRPKDALPFLKNADRAQPGNPNILIAMAQADVAANHLTEASSLFERAAHLDGKDAEAWYGLGITDRALAEQGLKATGGAAQQNAQALMDKANAAIAKAVQLDPDSTSAHMLMGETFRIAERYDEAVQEYQSATQAKPNFAPAWAGLAVAYSASGNDEQALQAATRALALDPNDAPTNVLIGATFLRQSDYVKAKEYAHRALELQPDLSSVHVVLAKIDLKEDRPDKALPELKAAVKDDLDGSTYYLLATTLRRLGRESEAAAAMQKYKQLHAAHVGPAVGNSLLR
jgi:tetratricopeptide (TPR) repeat protein